MFFLIENKGFTEGLYPLQWLEDVLSGKEGKHHKVLS